MKKYIIIYFIVDIVINFLWLSIYLGIFYYFEDRGLLLFIIYFYKIIVYNSVG